MRNLLLIFLGLFLFSCSPGITTKQLIEENKQYFEDLRNDLVSVANHLEPIEEYPSTLNGTINFVRKQGDNKNTDYFPIERLLDKEWTRGPRPLETSSLELRYIFQDIETLPEMRPEEFDEEADDLTIGSYKFARQIEYVVLGRNKTRNRYGDGLAEMEYFIYSVIDKEIIAAFMLSNIVDPIANKEYVEINVSTGQETGVTSDGWETYQIKYFIDELDEALKRL